MFSSSILEELRRRFPVLDVVQKDVALKKQGINWVGLCPFHSERTPSFFVTPQKQSFYCFGCTESGDVFSYIQKTQGLSFPNTVAQLAEQAGMVLEHEDPEHTAQKKKTGSTMESACIWFQEQLYTEEGQGARDFLKKRGVDRLALERFRIGWAPHHGPALPGWLEVGLARPSEYNDEIYPFFRGRLMFPIENAKGQVVAFGGRALNDANPKYLNSAANPFFHKKSTLYGWPHALRFEKKTPLVLVEGYFDVVHAQNQGLAAVAPMGTALTSDHLLQAWTRNAEIVLCFDGDDAGRQASVRALDVVLSVLKTGFSVRVALLPEKQDPGSLVESGKGSVLKREIENALPMFEWLWRCAEPSSNPTPEHAAAVRAFALSKIETIPDNNVRQAYQQIFRTRWFDWTSPPRFQKLQPAPTVSVPTLDPMESGRRVLFCALLTYDGLMDKALETLASMRIPENHPFGQRLIDAILSETNVKSAQEWCVFLSDLGFSISDLLSARLHTPFGPLETPVETVFERWADAFSHYQRRMNVSRDLDDARQNLMDDHLSETSWERLKTLKHFLTAP